MNYPRVLIVNVPCLNMIDQHGLSIRGWFADWPKENLAQIYSGADGDGEKFCGHNFKLGIEERRFGRLFFRIKSSFDGQRTHPAQTKKEISSQSFRKVSILRNRIGQWLLETGIWEIIFRPILSRRLENWVREFNPQVIYCQGYTLTFSWLPLLLQKRFAIPIVFQTTDDWPNYLYKNSLFVHPVVIRTASELMQKASLRFAICDKMAATYQDQFGASFETLMICDDISRFNSAKAKRLDPKEIVSVVYSGGLTHNRWESLIDLSKAADELLDRGLKVSIHIFTPSVPLIARNELGKTSNITIHPSASHDEVPCILKGADVLFLPETFDYQEAKKIGLSISSKSQIYMMSEKPILVYGSSEAGVVEYARRCNWAYVVDEQSISELKTAIIKITTDINLRDNLINKVREVTNLNHNGVVVREQFRESFCSLIN